MTPELCKKILNQEPDRTEDTDGSYIEFYNQVPEAIALSILKEFEVSTKTYAGQLNLDSVQVFPTEDKNQSLELKFSLLDETTESESHLISSMK